MAAASYFETVQKIYIAFYQRPADPAGLKYWAERISANGGDASAVVSAFATSPEAVALYGTINATTIGTVIDKIYLALFNKAPDAAGKQFYVDGFNAGTFTAGTIALNVLNGASGDDSVAIRHKLQVANEFTQQVDGRALSDPYFGTGSSFNASYSGDTDAQAARDILKAVTSSPSTVLDPAQVTEQVKTHIADAGDPILGQTSGQTFTLTVGADNFIGGTGNDTFNALTINSVTGTDAQTMGSFDALDGGAGTDTLNLYAKGSLANNVIGTVKNIETINIFNEGSAVFGAVDASKFAGATQVWQSAYAGAVSKLDASTTAGFKGVTSTAASSLSVTATDTAASATVALDGVKGAASTGGAEVQNRASLNVSGAALSSVTVAGTLAQTVNTPVAGEKEVFTATFSGNTTAADHIHFSTGGASTWTAGAIYTGGTAIAAAYTLWYNAQVAATWVAVDNLDGTVTFTAKTTGDRSDTTGDGTPTGQLFADDGSSGATGFTVIPAAPTTQGVDAIPVPNVPSLALNVTAGKDVEALTVKTAVASVLKVTDGVGGTKKVLSVDASASVGAVEYAAASTVANIKTGAGADKVTLATTLNATTKTASVSTGTGNDTITVSATVGVVATGQSVTVDAGEGNDTVNLAIATGAVAYDVKAGTGDDTVTITSGTVKTTDKIDGGDGKDAISLALAAPKTLVADDYIVFNKVLTNFETLQLTGSAATMDASLLGASYTTLDLSTGSTVTKVGTQALVANGALTATATGTDTAATPKVYAGTLNITEKATGLITANADTVNLTVDASKGTVAATLAGFAKSANVTLVQALKADKSAFEGDATFALTTSPTVHTEMTSLKLSGNGAATVTNAVSTKLATVDASGLNSVTFDGKVANGLTYASANATVETITLGAGKDALTIGASTYGAADTITGLNLVLNAGKTALETTSDTLAVTGATGAVKFTTTQTDLDLALKDAAALTGENVAVFQLGGNTYVYKDVAAGGANLVDAGDILVKLTGTIDLDALVIALA